jgi:hypothetical protein
MDKDVFIKGFKVGKIKDVIIDPEEWKVTHLELELSKEASEDVLGIKPAMLESPRNKLAISALEKGAACCTESGIELKVSKGQLGIYLRPL